VEDDDDAKMYGGPIILDNKNINHDEIHKRKQKQLEEEKKRKRQQIDPSLYTPQTPE
jgi:hypothetical protein